MSKALLFSVTANDCDFTVMRGTGPGGQKRNKTESKVRCVHRDSGASAYSDITRSQHENRRDAFVKMANTQKFKTWHRLETMRRLGIITQIEEKVEKDLQNTKIEIRIDGKWTEVNIGDLDNDSY